LVLTEGEKKKRLNKINTKKVVGSNRSKIGGKD